MALAKAVQSRPMSDFLIVKTSSMGDVIHALPAATDIARHLPGARIAWVVEEAFAGIPPLHPAVADVIPVAVRRWRKSPFSGTTRREIRTFRARLAEKSYDRVLDLQGLLKSALITRAAHGPRCGYDRHSIREPLAAWFYQQRFAVAKNLHAVERNRRLAGLALGYTPEGAPDYGIAAPAIALSWTPAGRYAALLHATSRDDKLWREADWIALGIELARQDIATVLPWGGPAERARAERLAAAIPSAVPAPALRLDELAALLANAVLTVGVDTGLTHLAAALGVPTIALYCASRPGLTGVFAASFHRNLGEAGQPPLLNDVLAAAAEALA